MDVLEAIYKRRATRSYTGQQLGEETVRSLLRAAVRAPSAINDQPWAFAVIQNRAMLDEISERSKELLLRRGALDSMPGEFRKMVESPEFHVFYDAGTLVVVCAKPDGTNPAGDCWLAAENLMLAAVGMGLSTCPVGFAHDWLDLPDTKRRLDIPADYSVVVAIIVGYAAAEPPPVPRKDPQVVCWHRQQSE